MPSIDDGPAADTFITPAIPVQKMQAERVRVLYRQASFVLLGNVLVAAILATFIYQITQEIVSFYWLAAIAGLTAIRYLMVRRFKQHELNETDTIRWGWFFAITAFISGCSWGVSSVLFLQTSNTTVMLFVLMTVTGIVVASSAALSSFAWSYYMFAIPAVLPFIFMLVSTGQPGFIELGAMLTIFLVLQLIVAKKNQNTLDNSIALRQENAGLIQELRVKNTKLESANSAKTRFLAAASHDLRQPLHAMSLFVDVLGERNRDLGLAAIVEKLRQSSSVLGELLESLLDISMLDARVVSVNSVPFSVQKLFDILCDEFTPLTEEKDLELIFMPTSLWVNSDEKIVARILRNLISNAIRYTKKGKVLVGCRRSADTVAVIVGDTGVGISSDHTEIIFEEFRQLENDNRDRHKGLGLGLSIVKRLTELLSAELSLYSRPGRGSLFSIKLPRCSPNEAPSIKSILFEDQLSLVGKTIVVVEDEEEIRDAIRLLLGGWGCRVLEAKSVADVKQQLVLPEKPDLILSDYRLPGHQTGIDAIHAIRAHCNDDKIPAVIITGDTTPEQIQNVKEGGFLIVHKPVSGGKLRAILSSILHHQ